MTDNQRIKITRGEDETLALKLRTKDRIDPLDLSAATLITVKFVKADRSILNLTNQVKPAVKAELEIEEVTFKAVNGGADGNTINLVFDGLDDVDTVVNAWNTANPMNQVEHDGDGDEIIAEGEYLLEGGYDSYTPVQVSGNPVLGKISVILTNFDTNSLRVGLNQSIHINIDYGPHPTGTRVTAHFDNQLDVVDDQ